MYRLPHSGGCVHANSPGTAPRRRGKVERIALLFLGQQGSAEAFS